MPSEGPVLTRRVSPRSFVVRYVVAALTVALVVWLAVQFPSTRLWLLISAPLPLVMVAIWNLAERVGTEFRLYDESIEVERGLFSRRIENIQLFRVRDLSLSQSLMGRLLGYGDIGITSTDQTSPRFTLRSVDAPRELYETLRTAVARSQATRRTMIVEDEAALEGGDASIQ